MQRGRPGGARGPRVIAGEQGGLRLVVPKGARTRPTSRPGQGVGVRRARRRTGSPGRAVLDLYAGSGALGDRGAVTRRGARRARRPRPARGRRDPAQPGQHPAGRPGPGAAPRRSAASCAAAPPGERRSTSCSCDPPYDLPAAELARILDARWPRRGGWRRTARRGDRAGGRRRARRRSPDGWESRGNGSTAIRSSCSSPAATDSDR